MSTEYYYRYNWCSHCGSYDEIPLLTSSAGWNPLWYSHTHPANISSVKELKEFMAAHPSLEAHSKDYKDGSWRNYSHEELGQLIAHLVKRASHRATKEKRTKDLYDARNYLSMMIAKFEEDSVLPQSTE